jgi:GxxExxY protein
MNENAIAKVIVDCCLKLHRALGPGLFESVYEEALCYELTKRSLQCKKQVGIKFTYRDVELDVGFRADVIVDGLVIVELKSIEELGSVHKKQLLTYLKLTKLKLGLLVNFNVPLMKDGIIRIVNGL